MAYFTTNEVRAILTGSTSDSTFDTLISQEGSYADTDIENKIYDKYGVSPPYTGDDITNDIAGAANWQTAFRVFGAIGQVKRKKDAEETVKQIIDAMANRFKAEPTTRTTTVSVTTDYRSEPLASE